MTDTTPTAIAEVRRETVPESPTMNAARIRTVPISKAGVTVTHDNALKFSAVWACVKVISETIASLEWHHYRQLPTGGRERVRSDIDWMLSVQASPEVSAFAFVEALIAHALTWGNGFAEIERGSIRHEPKWLHLITPNRVEPVRVRRTGELVYDISNSGEPNTVLQSRDMLHLKGLGYDGLRGYSVISMAARAVASGVASEEWGGDFYKNAATPSLGVKVPDVLSDEAYQRLDKEFNQAHTTLGNKHRVVILEGGIDVIPLSVPPGDAAFIDSRRLQVIEICRYYRVPPHKIGSLEKSSFSNIEQQAIEFVTDTLMPWVRRLETEGNIKLFGRNQMGLNFTRIAMQELLRGDIRSRSEALQIQRRNGVLSADEWREIEDMNPIGGVVGSTYVIEANMSTIPGLVRAAEAPAAPPPRPRIEPDPDDDDDENGDDGEDEDTEDGRAAAGLVLAALERITRRARHWYNDAAGRLADNREAFDLALARFCRRHRDYAAGELRPLLAALVRMRPAEASEADIDRSRRICDAFAATHVDQIRAEMVAAFDDPDVAALGDDWVFHTADIAAGWLTEQSILGGVSAGRGRGDDNGHG